ncbi:MAG: hypothetical protein QNK03_07710 [Myxococcota bacterium]|nr:hypothetical protein [Myxococcota bacterium]
MSGYEWRSYVPVAQRRARAAKKVARLRTSGREVAPVKIEGRKIARTFWGGAWCRNLEAYSDYANRLPRGRTYVRNGSVVDLQLAAGRISALVSGSDLYEVELRVEPLSAAQWKRVRAQCAGRIDSLVELLQGRLSDAVMDVVTRPGEGLFPTPKQIALDCSCPDWATMCKHVAAALYGVGARLDRAPELLFVLRGVDPAELVGDAVGDLGTKRKPARGRVLAEKDLSSVFGVEIDLGGAGDAEAPKAARGRRASGGKKVSRKRAGSRAGAGKVKTRASAAAGKKKKPAKSAAAGRKKKATASRAKGKAKASKKRSSGRKPRR